ncbi:hypothetical protein KKI24_00760 [bacterium]|nr:hypothetical protein [bacterium]
MWDKGGRIARRKIGVKYCGGCNPKYDRVALVQRMEQALSEAWEFVSWEDPTADHILIIAGCETACVDTGPFENRTVHWVNSPASSESAIDHLTNIDPGSR